MKKPKKLIRDYMSTVIPIGEWELLEDKAELNTLYALKVKEELNEIISSDYKDIMEFVDLIQVAFDFAKANGFTHSELGEALITKTANKGRFSNCVLTNLNPNNPSNKIYFEPENP